MDSFFKFGQAVPEIFELFSKNWVFFRQDLEETYISEIARKIRFLKGFLQFSGINTHSFVKNDRKFGNKSLFDAKFYGVQHENFFRSHSSFWVWG